MFKQNQNIKNFNNEWLKKLLRQKLQQKYDCKNENIYKLYKKDSKNDNKIWKQ